MPWQVHPTGSMQAHVVPSSWPSLHTPFSHPPSDPSSRPRSLFNWEVDGIRSDFRPLPDGIGGGVFRGADGIGTGATDRFRTVAGAEAPRTPSLIPSNQSHAVPCSATKAHCQATTRALDRPHPCIANLTPTSYLHRHGRFDGIRGLEHPVPRRYRR